MKKLFFAMLFVSLSIGAGAQDKHAHGSLKELNVDFMMRGYFCAGSKIEDKQAFGGFGTSENFPKAIDPKMSVTRDEVSLIAMPDEAAVFAGKYKGMKVVLVNATNETVGFPASDSRLYIVQEALDRQGAGNRLNTFRRVGVVTATTPSFLARMSIGSLQRRVTQANSKRGYASVWMNRSLGGKRSLSTPTSLRGA